jgi:hypothetical protein
MRVALILTGIALGLAGLFVAATFELIIGVGCHGTDAGEPPPPGTFGHTLCDSPALPVALALLGLAALVAPVVGGVVAARRGAYTPLLGWAAAAAGAVSALGLLIHAIEQGTESVELFVGLPVLVCVGLVAATIRQARSESR